MLEFAFKTDIGKVRKQNEDAVGVDATLQLAILADGMGGYNAGEVASIMAGTVIQKEIERHSQQYSFQLNEELVHLGLVHAVKQANAAIIEAAASQLAYRGMGTTLVVAWFQPQNKVSIAHVGDSRAYRIRSTGIEQLTRDHSLLQEQIDAGFVRPESAQTALNRNVITRAVGVDPQMMVEFHQHQLQADDIYLLCSDGLSDYIAAQMMHEIVTYAQGDLEVAVFDLIEAANQAGGADNISVILIKVLSELVDDIPLLDQPQFSLNEM